MNTQYQLKLNQNSNGGGLAHNITGRYESNRNALARLDDTKRTSGEVAKSLRKLGYNYKASEIKVVFEEWHHTGFYSKGMGRTYYTRMTDEQVLAELSLRKIETQKKYENEIFAIGYEWKSDLSGYRGKKRNFKTLNVWKGSEIYKPKNYQQCSEAQYNNAVDKLGLEYFGWTEPNINDFN